MRRWLETDCYDTNSNTERSCHQERQRCPMSCSIYLSKADLIWSTIYLCSFWASLGGIWPSHTNLKGSRPVKGVNSGRVKQRSTVSARWRTTCFIQNNANGKRLLKKMSHIPQEHRQNQTGVKAKHEYQMENFLVFRLMKVELIIRQRRVILYHKTETNTHICTEDMYF